MDVDTGALRCFVMVAEQLNFTRAAERLFLSQPTLSRRIRRLEEDLRTPLFERTGREVLLTPAGEAFLPLARGLLADWLTAQRTVRTVAAVGSRVLRVGFEASGAGSLATRAYTEFMRRHPDSTVEPKRFDWGGEVAALHEGLVDVAFVWLPADTTGLHTEIVTVERRMAGLAARHPLAGRADVSIMDLADEPIVWTRRAPRAWVDWWAVNPRPDGREPVWGPENDNVEEMLEHVASGQAICISPESMSLNYGRPDLTWLPVRDIAPLRVALCWPVTSASPSVAAFAAVVRRLSGRS
ncbi:LysR family transcriptional regulator [Actinomadura kijaniata]|uniref:DNA-binding transcriptional LysR family regulator n=1 Tax=Actinomadura namibiensis TaxID=182080 RepID=A0A7W3QRG6_ACTNM|nr:MULTISPECIES: LysR family transcriptional regulator [Actinomadura]MBA8956770.1 DNA-binding transcriptional LysR family regulator [Actinomadura namibiensis]